MHANMNIHMYTTILTVGDVHIKYSMQVKNFILPVSLYLHYVLVKVDHINKSMHTISFWILQ